MDNLFLEEFSEPIDTKDIKEIKINEQNNIFQMNNNNVINDIDDYDINPEKIIHKQDNISENTNNNKVYDISVLYEKEIIKERLLISYEDMNASLSYCNFNGSYECEFNLNKMYKNVIGFKLNKSIYECPDKSFNGSKTNTYLDVIVNNIPNGACINNLKGYNIIKRLPYEIHYHSNACGVSYDVSYDNDTYFYPINMDKLSLSLRYNYKKNENSDLIDLKDINNINFYDTTTPGLKFSFEFEITMLNR